MSPAKHVSTIENFRYGRGRLNAPTFAKGRRLQVNVHLTENWEFVHDGGAELVIEAVFEDGLIKADVIKKAEAATAQSLLLFASNTSTLPITKLAEAFGRPEDFIGLHFFSPVERMALVEVIRLFA